MSLAFTGNPVSIKNVLVLEDNFIIAMEADDILRSLGVEHVEIATNLVQAAELIETNTFDFALLDVNLGSSTSFDFAAELIARGIPFGFVSGYGEDSVFPPALREMPRITKPFNEASLVGLLANVQG